MFNFFSPNVPTVSVEEVKKSIDDQEPCIILDVRTQGEYQRGSIPGSMHIPLDDLASQITTKIPQKDQQIHVYCLSGSRSATAVKALIDMGYTRASSMSGGMLSWRAHKYQESNVSSV